MKNILILFFLLPIIAIAQPKKISELTETTTLADVDLFPTVSGGDTKKVTFLNLYNSLRPKFGLATVATSGSYADLSNTPTLFDGTWTSLSGKPTFATVATSGSYTDLSNRPAINDVSGLTNNYIPKFNSTTGKFENSSLFEEFNVIRAPLFTPRNFIHTNLAFFTESDIFSSGITNTGNITNSGSVTTATAVITGTLDVGALAQFNNGINMVGAFTIVSGSANLNGNVSHGLTGLNFYNGVRYDVRTLAALNLISPTEGENVLVTERGIRNAIDAVQSVENGLSVVAGKIRLGGSLLTGNTDIVNVTGSAIRIRNVGNTFSSYTFANNAFTVGDPSFLVNSVLNGTLGVSGTLTGTGNLNINGRFNVNATTGATTLTGTLAVTGATSVTGTNTFTVGTGATTLGGALNANGGILVNNQRIQNVGTPTAVADATTKAYVDGLVVFTVSNQTISFSAVINNVYLISGVGVTCTLPTAIGNSGRFVRVKRTDATNSITINTTGGQTIDGAATQTLTTNNQSMTFVSNGTNWFIIN